MDGVLRYQEVPSHEFGVFVKQQSQPGYPSHSRRSRLHKMKTVLFASLVLAASLAELTPEMAQAHSHKVCHWDHHHHRLCHWVD